MEYLIKVMSIVESFTPVVFEKAPPAEQIKGIVICLLISTAQLNNFVTSGDR